MSVHLCARIMGLPWEVRSEPSLRHPPELPRPVQVDEVLSALRFLDQDSTNARPSPDMGG